MNPKRNSPNERRYVAFRPCVAAAILLTVIGLSRLSGVVSASEHPGIASVLIDAQGGIVLEEQDADREFAAPGVARLLVALLTLEQVKLGFFDIDVPVAISAEAAAMDAGLLRLDPERTYPLEELLRAIFVAGARDATAAVADVICADAETCVRMLNERARLLGMSATRITDLSATTPEKAGVTTARDAARLARALVRHPEVVRWASLPGIPFDGGPVVLRNTNSLVGTVVGVDGLQVARVGGTCSVIATAKRNGARVVAVVMGDAALEACYDATAKLIERGFRSFASVELVREGETLKVSVEIEGGTVDHIAPVATRSFTYFQRRGAPSSQAVSLRYQIPMRLRAPVERNAVVGELIVERDGKIVAVIPARSPQRVGRSGLF